MTLAELYSGAELQTQLDDLVRIADMIDKWVGPESGGHGVTVDPDLAHWAGMLFLSTAEHARERARPS